MTVWKFLQKWKFDQSLMTKTVKSPGESPVLFDVFSVEKKGIGGPVALGIQSPFSLMLFQLILYTQSFVVVFFIIWFSNCSDNRAVCWISFLHVLFKNHFAKYERIRSLVSTNVNFIQMKIEKQIVMKLKMVGLFK